MTRLDSISKSRDITLLTKVCIVKAMIFPVVMYRCEKWTIKKAEHRRSDLSNCGAGEYSWESLGQQGDPANPKGNQPWILIGRTDAEGPILWPPDVKSWLIEKDPVAGKDWGQEGEVDDRGWDGWMDVSLSKFQEIVKDAETWWATVHAVGELDVS